MPDRIFVDPLWEDPNTRQRVRAREKIDGGSVDIVIDRNDESTWSILLEQFSEEYIEEETLKDIERFRSERNLRREQEMQNQEKQMAEMIFAEKLVAFEIPEIKSNKNKFLKRRLRKASTMAEVYAYAAAIVCDYDLNKDKYESS